MNKITYVLVQYLADVSFVSQMQHTICNDSIIPIDIKYSIIYRSYMKRLLNASDVARLLKVDRATIIRKIKRGEIQGKQQETGRKEWLVSIAAYEELLKKKL